MLSPHNFLRMDYYPEGFQYVNALSRIQYLLDLLFTAQRVIRKSNKSKSASEAAQAEGGRRASRQYLCHIPLTNHCCSGRCSFSYSHRPMDHKKAKTRNEHTVIARISSGLQSLPHIVWDIQRDGPSKEVWNVFARTDIK